MLLCWIVMRPRRDLWFAEKTLAHTSKVCERSSTNFKEWREEKKQCERRNTRGSFDVYWSRREIKWLWHHLFIISHFVSFDELVEEKRILISVLEKIREFKVEGIGPRADSLCRSDILDLYLISIDNEWVCLRLYSLVFYRFS